MKMKLKVTIFALVSFLAITGNCPAQTIQRKTVTPTFVTSKPSSCNSALTTDQLIVVQNDGLYQCVSNKLVKAGGGTTTNLSAQTTTLAQLKAVTDTDSNTPLVYQMDSAQNVNSAMTIAKNVALQFATGGKFNYLSGSLTVNGSINAPRMKIFSGFNKDNLVVSASADYFYPEWFGAVGDNSTDDNAALQLMLDTVHYPGANPVGGRDLLAAGKTYYSSKTLHVGYITHLDSASGGGGRDKTASAIRFPTNTTGIIFEGATTEREAVDAAMTAGSYILNATFYNGKNASGATATPLTQNDVGKYVYVHGAAGAAGALDQILLAQISSVQSGTQATLSAPATATIANQRAYVRVEHGSEYSSISNIKLIGAVSGTPTYTHTVSILPDGGLVRLTGARIEQYRGYPAGTMVLINGVDYLTEQNFPAGQGDYFSNAATTTAGSTAVTLNSAVVTANASWRDADIRLGSYSYKVASVTDATHITLDRPALETFASNSSILIVSPLRVSFHFPGFINGNAVHSKSYVSFNAGQIGSIIRINSVDYKIASIVGTNDVTVTYPDNSAVNVSPLVEDTDIYFISFGAAALAAQNARWENAHGIDVRSKMDINNVSIVSFEGNGINGDSLTLSGPGAGSDANLNYASFTRNQTYDNSGHGLYLRGTNGNVIKIENNDFNASHGYGTYDLGFLGNTYITNHAGNNGLGSHFTGGAFNRAMFLAGYVEGGGSTSIFSPSTTVLGGDVNGPGGSDYRRSQEAYLVPFEGEAGTFLTGGIRTVSKKPSDFPPDGHGDSYTSVLIGQGDRPNQPNLMGVGNSDERGSNPPDRPSVSYVLTYAQYGNPAPYWYGWQYGGINARDVSANDNTVLAFSGGLAAEGPKQLWMPNGFYIGRTGSGLVRSQLIADALGLKLDKNFAASSFQLSPIGTRPTCASATQGTIWIIRGAKITSPTADVPYLCLKNADDTYTWHTITTN